jgi:hypothetical protein
MLKGLVKRNILQAKKVNELFQLNGIKPVNFKDMPIEEFKEKYPMQFNLLINIK